MSVARPTMTVLLLDVLQSFRRHRWLMGLVVFHVGIAFAVQAFLGLSGRISLSLYQLPFVAVCLAMCLVLLVGRVIYIMIAVRPAALLRAIAIDLTQKWLAWHRLMNALPVLIAITVCSSVFTSVKSLIPFIHPYDWDSSFAAWDETLHFGVAPWRILQPVLGRPETTGFLNVLYNMWAFVVAGCWFWQAFSLHDPRLRTQFFISFVLCLALPGNLFAILLSSVGPCSYGRIVPGYDPFLPLLTYLRHASLTVPAIYAVQTQDYLWKIYANHAFALGSGISAAPSLHIATATLLALLGWRVHRILGVALTMYAGILLIGSVHLAWHYALDGYLGIIGAVAIWWMVGAVMRVIPDEA